MEADSVDRMAENMGDTDVVVEIEVEDMDHLLKRQPIYLWLAVGLLHYLEEEKEHRDSPQIP